MTMGISAVSDLSDLSMLSSVSKKTGTDSDENSNDIFSTLFQTIDNNFEQIQNTTNQTTETNSVSNIELGPPSNIQIENFEYSDDSISQEVTSDESLEISQSSVPQGGGGGGSSDDEDDDDESYDPMDLNQDGTVTTTEMLTYFKAFESYGSSNEDSSKAIEEILDLMV